MAKYKRVLIKLSGEALKSTGSELFDFPMVQHVAHVIKEMHDLGTEIGIVIGAGNIWRGRQGPSAHMDAVTADQMGMLGTMINCLCVADALRKEGLDAVVMSDPLCGALQHHDGPPSLERGQGRSVQLRHG